MPHRKNQTAFKPDLEFESRLWAEGIRAIAGVDEAGRGALAGPVSAGVLVLPPDLDVQETLVGMYDSKKLSPHDREAFSKKISAVAMGYAVGFATAEEIDRLGILPATRLAVSRALDNLRLIPEHLLVDYISIPECNIPQTSIVKGDERSLSIAGASILAKVARDELMRKLDEEYPGYNFAAHKGYGTWKHRCALSRLGPSPEHRRSFNFQKTGI